MKISCAAISGIIVIEPTTYTDERGIFFETYHIERYAAAGIGTSFPQDNRSVSKKNVLRGLHYQVKHPQGHLVTLTRGTIFDVGVDLRRGSPTFGHVFTITLTAEHPRQVFHPPGIAHGFCVLSDVAEIWYKCTERYFADDEGGLLWSDPDLAIDWPLKSPIVSSRDAAYPRLKDIAADHLPHVRA